MVATVFSNGHKSHRVPTLAHQQQAQTHRQQVKELLPNRIVAYSPDLAKAVGGATIGLFLSQLLFLSDKGHDPEGWVYKSEFEMEKETGLTKREQQTSRRKLLALGVIAIIRGGFRNTYHFKILWEKLYQVIAGVQRPQTVATEKDERAQTVPTEPVQNVSTKWKQNAAAPATYRENNRELQRTERTDREESLSYSSSSETRETEQTWNKALEQITKELPIGETEDRLVGTRLLEVTQTAARIGVNNPFAVAWLERRFYNQIASALKGVLGKDYDLQFVAYS